MTIIRITEGNAAQQAKLQNTVRACLADTPERYTIIAGDHHAARPQASGVMLLSGSDAVLSLIIGFAGAETHNVWKQSAVQEGKLPESDDVVGYHARLLVYSDENPDVVPPPDESARRSGSGVDSVHPWPESGQNSRESFNRWLHLGIALAEARHATQLAQHTLADAWIEDRKRWAEHIHGGPIQELVASTFMLGALAPEIAQPIEDQLLKTIGQLREFSQTMKPPVMGELGLASAVRATLRQWQQRLTDLNPTTLFDEEVPELNDRRRDILFLIFQKLLTALLTSAPGNGESVRLIRLDMGDEDAVSMAADSAATAAIRLMVVWGKDDAAQVDSVSGEAPEATEHPGTAAVKQLLPLMRQLARAISATILLTQTHADGGTLVIRVPLRYNAENILFEE